MASFLYFTMPSSAALSFLSIAFMYRSVISEARAGAPDRNRTDANMARQKPDFLNFMVTSLRI